MRERADKWIDAYRRSLVQAEKSGATVEKYLRDVRAFLVYAGEKVQFTRDYTG